MTIDAQVTLLTPASNSMADRLTSIFAHYDAGNSLYHDLVGGASGAFRIQPKVAGKDEMTNFRLMSTGDGAVCVDPLGNLTDSGDLTTAPAATDDTRLIETAALDFNAADAVDFYLVEFEDAMAALIQNSAKTFTARGCHAGRVWLNLDRPDLVGFGVLGGVPTLSSSGSGTAWVATTTTTSLIEYAPGLFAAPSMLLSSIPAGRVDGSDVPTHIPIEANNVDGTVDRFVGVLKYLKAMASAKTPGVWYESPSEGDPPDTDALVHIHSSAAVQSWVLHWDPETGAPQFA